MYAYTPKSVFAYKKKRINIKKIEKTNLHIIYSPRFKKEMLIS